MKPLTYVAKSQIEDVLWHTYGTKYPGSDKFTFDNTFNVYLEEKGISKKYTGCLDNEIPLCEEDAIVRNNELVGLVGLMSISDAGYANGWLYVNSWSITPFAVTNTNEVWSISKTNASPRNVDSVTRVLPSVYLKQDIKIISGNGDDKPYILGIE